jgi:hypothetical protein
MSSNRNIPTVLKLSSAVVALAAALVPDDSRAEWQEEWLAEVWVTHEALASQGPVEFAAKLRLVWRCFGAFVDASSLTADHLVPSTESAEGREISSYAVTSLFGAYVILFLLTDLVARPVALHRYGYFSIAYAYSYWATDTAVCLGAYLALFSLSRRTFGGSRAMWRYVRALLIGTLIVTIALFAVQPPVSHYRIFFLARNLFPVLFAQSLLLCVFLARSGNSLGLKWLAFGLCLQMTCPGLSIVLPHFDFYSSSTYRYVMAASSYAVVVAWLCVIVMGRQGPRASS